MWKRNGYFDLTEISEQKQTILVKTQIPRFYVKIKCHTLIWRKILSRNKPFRKRPKFQDFTWKQSATLWFDGKIRNTKSNYFYTGWKIQRYPVKIKCCVELTKFGIGFGKQKQTIFEPIWFQRMVIFLPEKICRSLPCLGNDRVSKTSCTLFSKPWFCSCFFW